MGKASKYIAHKPDDKGLIQWSDTENDTWQNLVNRQLDSLDKYACAEYLEGVDAFSFSAGKVPQLHEIDSVLQASTGWKTEPVPALIDFAVFFELLSRKRFPVATFIRTVEDFDYLQEPDVFHEIFGHCPMLTNPSLANFTENYGRLGLAASREDRVYLARLYWFTVEFGLINNDKGLSIYGGGILSSVKESEYALNSDIPERLPFDLLTVLRTPYRIDILQPVYFCLDSIDQLFKITEQDIMAVVQEAKKLGMLPAKFPDKKIVNS